MELDLHGLSVEEATSAIMMAFLSFLDDESQEELVVITGKGTFAMQTTFLNLLDQEESLYCTETNGGGSYIVKKRH